MKDPLRSIAYFTIHLLETVIVQLIELCKIDVYGPTKLIEKEQDIGHVIKIMCSQLRSIVRDKGNRITSITLIFGHVKTA